MASHKELVGIRFGVFGKDGWEPAGPTLTQWHLSEPSLPVNEDSSATAEFDFLSPETNEHTASDVWMFVYLGGEVVGESRFGVLKSSEGLFGARSLLLAADAEELWRQIYLLQMLANPATISASLLKTEAQRWGWIGASVKYSNVITPWLWGDSSAQRFDRTRPVPQRLHLTLKPQMFASQSIFYSQVGERLFGPAGYAGRDLHGFAEIVRRAAHLVEEFDVHIVEPSECERVASGLAGTSGFFTAIAEILNGTSLTMGGSAQQASTRLLG